MINEFCCYLKHTSSRLLYFVQQTGIVRFFLLFKQYGVKILITSIWDTQYIWVLIRVCIVKKGKLKRFVLFFFHYYQYHHLILLRLFFTALFSSCILRTFEKWIKHIYSLPNRVLVILLSNIILTLIDVKMIDNCRKRYQGLLQFSSFRLVSNGSKYLRFLMC